MQEIRSGREILTRQMFRLLPVQIFLAAIGAVEGIISGFFASNFIGVEAMSAVGIYAPVNTVIYTLSMILVSGSSILCGEYMGRNEQEKVHRVFTLSLVLSAAAGILLTAVYILLGLLDLTGFLVKDSSVRALFNSYLLGQAVGLIPYMLGNQLTMFLSLENRTRWSAAASFSYIAAVLLLDILFVRVMRMGAVGLALASGLGLWVFFGVQAVFYLSGRSRMKLTPGSVVWKDAGYIFSIGFPGSATYAYQALRGFIVNALLQVYIGSIGISAFTAANNTMAIFWAVPMGMIAVSRMLIGVSIGEEDRQTLTDVMRVAIGRFIPLMTAISCLICLAAVPLTHIYYRDPADPVYMMTVWGMRLLPFSMPFAIFCTHFTCYGQASGKTALIHIMSLLDGVLCAAGFTALLIGPLGMNSVYIATILNGMASPVVFGLYSVIKNRRIPRTMDELMVIPDDFGAGADQRLDLTVRNIEEVITISEEIQEFCLDKGLDTRRAYLAGLATEEMAGNIVEHGFTKDHKKHTIDVRVVYKDGEVIIRLRDDCTAFDPLSRSRIAEGDDPAKNIGIRMIYGIIRHIEYQNILGLNVLMVRI